MSRLSLKDWVGLLLTHPTNVQNEEVTEKGWEQSIVYRRCCVNRKKLTYKYESKSP